eukprot:TRINITY_DN10536_c0_g1_i1.p1 TRINITY_DN10536_c0_g1~~TRINITY_DN10536_c0_g1_i1.p1  ORF type:complete len:143 (-),score=18.71 TRINITY_DN10536_c0_g1_i1:64-492(-)
MEHASKVLLSNFMWFVCGGFMITLEYVFCGLFFMATCILFATGTQILRLSTFIAAPLNRNWSELAERNVTGTNPSAFVSILRSCLWFPWLVIIFLTHLFFIVLLTLSIVGVPLAHLHWRMCHVVLYPLFMGDFQHRILLAYS